MNSELVDILTEISCGRLAPARELASIVGRSMAVDGQIDRTEWASGISGTAKRLNPKIGDSEAWATFGALTAVGDLISSNEQEIASRLRDDDDKQRRSTLRERIRAALSEGDMRPAELASRLGTSRPSVARAISDLLEEDGVEIRPLQPGADRRTRTYGLKGSHMVHRVEGIEKDLFSHTNVEAVPLTDSSLDVDRVNSLLQQLTPESLSRDVSGSSRKEPPAQVPESSSETPMGDSVLERDIDKGLLRRESSFV